MTERTALYRLFDDNDSLLYVGITNNVKKRWQWHEQTKSWWHLVTSSRVEWLGSREEARTAELKAMRDESPRFNGIRHPDGSFTQGQYDDSAERDHALEELRRDLASGFLRPGDRIRTVQLGRRYGTSAMSVGMALGSLPTGTTVSRGNFRYVADTQTPGTAAE